MLFTLVITHLFALVASNPFHKYPYVFLLDVGNEDLQKTNSEQIRVSIPGGSLALRYPAFGDGDTISHVRVSGIDFGTDLKVNIVDGGPGSKYVVLAFMGNPGVAYDAVLTLQTVSEVNAGTNTNEISEEDANNSAEETNDSENDINKFDPKLELTQASSHNYNYANNEIRVSDDYSNNSANENSDNDYDNNELEDQHTKISNQNTEVTDYDKNNDDSNVESEENENNDTKEEFDANNAYIANEYYNREEAAGIVDNLYYDRLNFVRPYLYNGVRIHPDQAMHYSHGNNFKTGEGELEGDQRYVNDDVHEVSKDNNNNDSNDNSPVES